MSRSLWICIVASCVAALYACSSHTGSTASTAHSPPAQRSVDLSRGAKVFAANCASCHGATGREGGVGPSLTHENRKMNAESMIAWVENPQPPMPKLYPSALSDQDVADVAAYVGSL
ncbi:MAG: cytochrome c [Candidatus Eremiobacteraeota bacterium]|nr:cytochrome c [Candidatus Eremiobacteraeota bacterium]